MSGETSLAALLRSMRPQLNEGSYVFCTLADWSGLQPDEVIGSFREQEGLTVIVSRGRAEALKLPFSYEAAWITLTVHSSLEAVGLTAAFATALGQAQQLAALPAHTAARGQQAHQGARQGAAARTIAPQHGENLPGLQRQPQRPGRIVDIRRHEDDGAPGRAAFMGRCRH